MKKRKDLYLEVHKGLRKGLMNMLMGAGRLDVENDEQLTAFVEDVNYMLELLTGHAHHENEWIQPHINNIDKNLADTIQAEHSEYDKRSHSLRAEYQKLLKLERGQRSVAGDTAYRLCADFVGWYLRHISKEELEVMPKLQEKLSDDELMGIEHKMLEAIPPENMAKYMKLIVPSINPEELRVLLGGMKQFAPPEAFQAGCSIAEASLPPDEWRALKDFLS